MAYVRRLEELVGCRVSLVSVGPERGAMYDVSEDNPPQKDLVKNVLDKVSP
jgi:hypothetical protein